ncbi:exonuclease SbcCD subunit D [Lactococcus kimchii]|uniref:exonuclease SbcCD subunit D n=1 Tax=Lactococcus sp. S-13 TaxID=2507158 RepID=UPI001023B092|nr:exonuclease SbcCD subunit D [Lactococcus sp. S-13]RZI48195.1 exonuclease SbcCD subunit D [Lactococcus sp. S-13]
MKLLHTADWHIGRTLNGYDLLDEQKHAFEQIVSIAKKEKVDGIIIAGDLYDRAVPSTAAVTAFNEMLKRLNILEKFPLYMISGNHDGAKRLNYGRDWLSYNKLYLNTLLEEAFEAIETPEAQLFLLPFFDPIDARIYFSQKGQPEEEVQKIKTISDAMALVIEKMISQFTPNKKHILITHFAVTKGKEDELELTSETLSKVGGLASISATQFAAFDHVALGHIHTALASPSTKVQYSGSPVKFNTKEAKNQKGVYLLEISSDAPIHSRFIPLTPKTDLIVLQESWETLMDKEFYSNYPCHKAWFAITIKDFERVAHAGENLRAQLQTIYGTIIELDYQDKQQAAKRKARQNIETMSNEKIISSFYERVTGAKISPFQTKIIENTLIKLEGEQK